jgi:hypothetical protein
MMKMILSLVLNQTKKENRNDLSFSIDKKHTKLFFNIDSFFFLKKYFICFLINNCIKKFNNKSLPAK